MDRTSAKRYFVGLISGTSVDGIDAGVFVFDNENLEEADAGSSVALLASHSFSYTADLRQQILTLCSPGNNEIDALGELDVRLGQCFAQAALAAIEEAQLKPSDIEAIGSHGQTIRHRPSLSAPFTLQIGDPNVIAEYTGITCVADLRRRDMAAGGQGAPLAPAFHHAVFFSPEEKRGIVNIGGISNVSLLHEDAQEVLGYDTGPGNILLDAWIHQHLGREYDKDGAWAAQGKVNSTLLDALMQHEYFTKASPKSTGREDFHLPWLNEMVKPFDSERPENVQATLVDFTAQTIANELLPHPLQRVAVCGGGAHNKTLMKRLQEFMPKLVVESTEALGIPPDWVEAGLIAWIAKQTMDELPANLPAVTGAKKAVKLGAIFPA